jgi:hypothetical protein
MAWCGATGKARYDEAGEAGLDKVWFGATRKCRRGEESLGR